MKTYFENNQMWIGGVASATGIGAGVVSALHMMNEILQGISLLIGTTVGLLTLLHIIKARRDEPPKT